MMIARATHGRMVFFITAFMNVIRYSFLTPHAYEFSMHLPYTRKRISKPIKKPKKANIKETPITIFFSS